MSGGSRLGRARPLNRTLAEPVVGDAANVVTGGGVRELLDLLEDLFGAGVRERLGIAESAGHVGDDLPVGECSAGCFDSRLEQREVPLGVDHDAMGLGPQRSGQHDIGVSVGLGVGEGVLGDHQFGTFETVDHGCSIGHGRNRIGADDPASFDVARSQLREHLDGSTTDVGAQCSGRDSPGLLDERAVGVVGDRPLARQSGAHVSHFPATHRVRLTGQREGAAAGPADSTRRQVEIAQCVGVPGAVGGLIESHRPTAHPVLCSPDHLRCGTQIFLGETGCSADLLGGVIAKKLRHRVPAVGELGDEVRVCVSAVDDQSQQAVEQRQIGSRFEHEVQVRLVGGGGAPRIDHDQFRTGLDPVHHSQKQDGVAVGYVGADDEEHVGVVEVFVRPRRTVGSE
ncbi:unannotated protein [freshwater metagenome]|uniref:Unannotated protein n=1 Tax=freshwater metagenome TaxID=449393 RepID=A0A6J7HN90_9ZZZZ